MIDLKELKEIALANVVDPTSEYLFRHVCRWYSKTFHTPLHVVITEIPLSEVFLAYFEEGYEMMDEDERLVEVMRAIDPSFDEKEEESIQDFIKLIEFEEQNKRLAKAARDKAKNLANANTPTNPSGHNTQATPPTPPPPSTTPVVRTYIDDTPSDEELDEELGIGFGLGLDEEEKKDEE
jgi:hypothetical protein